MERIELSISSTSVQKPKRGRWVTSLSASFGPRFTTRMPANTAASQETKSTAVHCVTTTCDTPAKFT